MEFSIQEGRNERNHRKGEIGMGTHVRYIIDTAKFMEKLNKGK